MSLLEARLTPIADSSTWNLPDPHYDLVVVGAGHAGIEASLAGARLGLRTLLITMSLHTIGQMSCNPAIGGIGKGQLVREVDALGGEMGRAADRTGIQFRMLNRSKGAAVWSPRCQSDKHAYAQQAVQTLMETTGLDMRQGQVVDLDMVKDCVRSVIVENGTRIHCGAVIICSGTFLQGKIHVGDTQTASGRAGEPAAVGLSQALTRLGVEIRRYKTGTPPRVDRQSIHFDRFDVQTGDAQPAPFRYYENLIHLPQVPCFSTWTNERTHEILRSNLHRSPLFSGQIEGVGPRYCPSVEDKVVRFNEKDRHQIFLEPESATSREMYVNGFSTSMPEDVQLSALRTVAGFEDVRFIRPGYAIEYDYFPAWQIGISFRARGFKNLYFAGQINGTSGYEEAGAQGLLAALNAVAHLDDRDSVVLGRDQAYLGVLADDLVNKPLSEPYRMFTSRAEFRLLLRQDNADRRLMRVGHACGLLENRRWEIFLHRELLREQLLVWLGSTTISHEIVRRLVVVDQPDHALSSAMLDGSPVDEELPVLATPRRAMEWLKRPDVGLSPLLAACGPDWAKALDMDLLTSLETELKYAGYIERQQRSVENFRRNENVLLPDSVDYSAIHSITTEARERLAMVQPRSLGQAARIGGVNPTDVQALWVYLNKSRRHAAPEVGPQDV